MRLQTWRSSEAGRYPIPGLQLGNLFGLIKEEGERSFLWLLEAALHFTEKALYNTKEK